MLIILPEFTVRLEDFSAFRVVEITSFYNALQGYTIGEWIELYRGGEENVTEKKVSLDKAIRLSQRQKCPECVERDLKHVDKECCCEKEGDCCPS